MTNIYEELETMCLRCECRSDLKCGTAFRCKTYNNLHDALRLVEKLTEEQDNLFKEWRQQIQGNLQLVERIMKDKESDTE